MKPVDWEHLESLRERQQNDNAFRNLSDVYVQGEGDNPEALIIGEAPGAQEEIKGRPFIGPAGKVLRNLMHIAHYCADASRCEHYANCWLTNVVKFRPPGNRNPTRREITIARIYLREEWIAVGKPQLIIPVGGIALSAVLGRYVSILAVSGKPRAWRTSEGGTVVLWPMIHPSFGLRTKLARPLMEQDWEKLGEWRAAHQG